MFNFFNSTSFSGSQTLLPRSFDCAQDDAKGKPLRCNGAKASVKALEASCNAKLSHTSKAMLRPPPTRALPQSRHSERGAFTRLSAKNLLATLASQTLLPLQRPTPTPFILTDPRTPAVISTIRNYVYFFYINNDTGLKSITFLNIFKKILKIAKICSKLVVKF